MITSPDTPQSTAELDDRLSQPSDKAVDALAALDGDIMLLGAGGKMGPTLAHMAKRGSEISGHQRRVIAVSRFSDAASRQRLEQCSIETISCDLLDRRQIAKLPEVPNVIVMTGMKFGASKNPPLAWAMNCLIPSVVCQNFSSSRIVAFSSGNVYGPVSCDSAGSKETDLPNPDGEYAMTVLGRERLYEYFSDTRRIPTALLRLNYATEMRYGVLVDIAKNVFEERPISLAVPRVNVIWQGDANSMALTAFNHTTSPATVINVAGTELLDVEEVARQMAQFMGKPVQFLDDRGRLAFLNDGHDGQQLLGTANVSARELVKWTAEWVAAEREHWAKPTHFEVTSGRY